MASSNILAVLFFAVSCACVHGLTFLRFSPRAGFIRLSHAHRFHFHFLPHFRKFHRTVSPPESSDAFSNGVHDAENVFHMLKNLPKDCFTYEADDKYTYEYCHMESARQTGKMAQNNLLEEYNLGHYCPQRSIQKYSPLLRLAKITLVGGDPCGEGISRTTKVKFFCVNPKLSMHIVSAREKSTCNYRILVHVPELCFK